MSLFEDYEVEMQFARDFPFGVPCDIWKSKNGAIKVSDMTESHIRNAMRIVGEDDAWYKHFAEELKRRKGGDKCIYFLVPGAIEGLCGRRSIYYSREIAVLPVRKPDDFCNKFERIKEAKE